MSQLDSHWIQELRLQAREGVPPSRLFRQLKQRLGQDVHILTILHYFQAAFCLSLSEAKPFAALSRNQTREVHDEAFLDRLMQPPIQRHQPEWESLS